MLGVLRLEMVLRRSFWDSSALRVQHILHAPKSSENAQEHVAVPALFCVSPPDAAARCHSCGVARDVFPCTRVESEPATVQPLHSEVLL